MSESEASGRILKLLHKKVFICWMRMLWWVSGPRPWCVIMLGGVESRGNFETKVVISWGFWKDGKVWVDTAHTLRSDFVDPQHLPFWLCFKCYTLADSFSAMLRIILAVRTWALLSAQDFVALSIITSFRRGTRCLKKSSDFNLPEKTPTHQVIQSDLFHPLVGGHLAFERVT